MTITAVLVAKAADVVTGAKLVVVVVVVVGSRVMIGGTTNGGIGVLVGRI